MEFITLVNGESKPIEFYYLEKTMYACPWCGYATTFETGCQNPGCWTAFKTVETLQAAQAKYNKEKAEQAERDRILAIRNKSYGKL